MMPRARCVYHLQRSGPANQLDCTTDSGQRPDAPNLQVRQPGQVVPPHHPEMKCKPPANNTEVKTQSRCTHAWHVTPARQLPVQ
jgi:hypothetical protein